MSLAGLGSQTPSRKVMINEYSGMAEDDLLSQRSRVKKKLNLNLINKDSVETLGEDLLEQTVQR